MFFFYFCNLVPCLDDHLKHHLQMLLQRNPLETDKCIVCVSFFLPFSFFFVFLSKRRSEEQTDKRRAVASLQYFFRFFIFILSYRIGGRCSIDLCFVRLACIHRLEHKHNRTDVLCKITGNLVGWTVNIGLCQSERLCVSNFKNHQTEFCNQDHVVAGLQVQTGATKTTTVQKLVIQY